MLRGLLVISWIKPSILAESVGMKLKDLQINVTLVERTLPNANRNSSRKMLQQTIARRQVKSICRENLPSVDRTFSKNREKTQEEKEKEA